MTDYEKQFSLGQQIILTGLSAKEGLKKAFSSKGYDITNEHFALLSTLWKKDGQPQIDLCEKTCKSKSNITRILDTMEKRNLIERRTDKNDRRKLLIYLTARGKSLQSPLNEIAAKFAIKSTQGMGEEELETLFALLSRISSNIEK